MTHTIMQVVIECVKVMVQAMSEAASPKGNDWAAIATGKMAIIIGPSLKQPTFNQKVWGKYSELLNFKMEVKKYFYVQELWYQLQ